MRVELEAVEAECRLNKEERKATKYLIGLLDDQEQRAAQVGCWLRAGLRLKGGGRAQIAARALGEVEVPFACLIAA